MSIATAKLVATRLGKITLGNLIRTNLLHVSATAPRFLTSIPNPPSPVQNQFTITPLDLNRFKYYSNGYKTKAADKSDDDDDDDDDEETGSDWYTEEYDSVCSDPETATEDKCDD